MVEPMYDHNLPGVQFSTLASQRNLRLGDIGGVHDSHRSYDGSIFDSRGGMPYSHLYTPTCCAGHLANCYVSRAALLPYCAMFSENGKLHASGFWMDSYTRRLDP